MSYKVSTLPANHQFIAEENETLLDAGLKNNIGLPYGCRNGRCGSCLAVLTSGEVSYPEGRPELLENEAANACLPCKAVANTDVVINVRENETTADIEPKIMPCRVIDIDHLAHDVIRLQLKLPDNQRLQFKAGQYLDFILADKSRRAFSIANAPDSGDVIELHIRHVDGGKFTDWAFSLMKEKAILRIEAPLGSFVLNENSDRPMIFVGGGTGFAPLKGQIEQALHAGTKTPMHLYWGVRAERDLYLPDLPQSWVEQFENFSFTPVLSEPDSDWPGRSGWVHEAVVADHADLTSFDIYMAGPPPMITAARTVFSTHGHPADQLYYDSFEYAAETEE